jgi:hypothetical protein
VVALVVTVWRAFVTALYCTQAACRWLSTIHLLLFVAMAYAYAQFLTWVHWDDYFWGAWGLSLLGIALSLDTWWRG